MKKLVIAAVAALFAFAVHAAPEKSSSAAPQSPAAEQRLSAEECKQELAKCDQDKDDKECRMKLKKRGCE